MLTRLKRKQQELQEQQKLPQKLPQELTPEKKTADVHLAYVYHDPDVEVSKYLSDTLEWAPEWVHNNQGMEASAHAELDSSTKAIDLRRVSGMYMLKHGFLTTLTWAYSEHLPVQFGPQHIWLMVMQGIAQHVSIHAERLKGRFMKDSGTDSKQRASVAIRRDNFVPGSPNNDWHGTFTEFRQTIKNLIHPSMHDWYQRAVKPFSCSSDIDVAATEIALLESMHHYVDMKVQTMCGFPEIRLEGTVMDWTELSERVLDCIGIDLDDEHFQQWTYQVMALIDHILDLIKGSQSQNMAQERSFWNSMIRANHQSGSEKIDGWILSLVPYLVQEVESDQTLVCSSGHPLKETDERQYPSDGFLCNGCGTSFNFGASQHCAICKYDLCRYCTHRQTSKHSWVPNLSPRIYGGKPELVDTCKIPDGISRVPFEWQFYGKSMKMVMESGFVNAAETTKTKAELIRPHVSWCVRHASK